MTAILHFNKIGYLGIQYRMLLSDALYGFNVNKEMRLFVNSTICYFLNRKFIQCMAVIYVLWFSRHIVTRKYY